MPVALLRRLAVRRDFQDSGLVNLLLASTIKSILAIADEIGIGAMIVGSIDESVKAFYEHFEFRLHK